MALKTKKEENTIPKEAIEIMDNTQRDPVPNEQENALADYEILNPELPLNVKIEPAVKFANTLKTVIESQELVVTGLNKKNPEQKYVLTGGWEMLNTFMGIAPVTKVIDDITNSKGRVVGYKAQCTLLKNPIYENGEIKGGRVFSHAEASATIEGFQKETSTMMSMAETRAFNKATRQALGWIMEMAGYQGTPAEEMPTYK